jgi:hypothetical protein
VSLLDANRNLLALSQRILLAVGECSVADRTLVWRAMDDTSTGGSSLSRRQQAVEALRVCAADLNLMSAPSRRQYSQWQQLPDHVDNWLTEKQVRLAFGSWRDTQRGAGFDPDLSFDPHLRGQRSAPYSRADNLNAIGIIAGALGRPWFSFGEYYEVALKLQEKWLQDRRGGLLREELRLPLSQWTLQKAFRCWPDLVWHATRPTDRAVLLEMSERWRPGDRGWSDQVLLNALCRAARDSGLGGDLTDAAYIAWVPARRRRVCTATVIATVPSFGAQQERWGSLTSGLIEAGLRVPGQPKRRPGRKRGNEIRAHSQMLAAAITECPREPTA